MEYGGILQGPPRSPKSQDPVDNSQEIDNKKKKKKSVRFSNAVTVKVVPRISQVTAPKTSFIYGTLLDPSTRTFRYLLLFLLCIQTYGVNFSRFAPFILQDSIQKLFSITSTNSYLILIAMADIPALALVLLGGYLCDKYYTVGKWAVVFSTGVILGQLLLALGCYMKSIVVLMAGRVLFEVCAGSMYVVQAMSMARWLAGLEMGLAMGFALCLSELTYYFAQWMLPIAANDYGVAQSFLLGALMAVGSLSATILASVLDAWGNDQLPKSMRASIYLGPPSPDTSQTIITTNTMTASMTTPSRIDPVVINEPLYTSTPQPPSSNSFPTDTHSPQERNLPPQILAPSEIGNYNPHILSTTPNNERTSPVGNEYMPHYDEHTEDSISTHTRMGYDEEEDVRGPPNDFSNLKGSPAPVRRPNADGVTRGANIFSASMQISTRGTSPHLRRTLDLCESPDMDARLLDEDAYHAFDYVSQAKNDARRHRRLLVMLVIAALLILPAGVLNHNYSEFQKIIYVGAAAAPAVGWVIDRAGRPCLFLGLGTIAQIAVQLTAIFALVIAGLPQTIHVVVQTALGVTWAITVCGAYACVALLVYGGHGGVAFACVIVVTNMAIALAPLFYAVAMTNTQVARAPVMEALVPACAATSAGLILLFWLYKKKSILNMKAYDIRRVIGYTQPNEENLPLLIN